VAAGWTTDYKDIHYKCWHCQADSVFTAVDQKYTYEEKKAPIDQRRVLCEVCWREALGIAAQLQECKNLWASSKQSLREDEAFLRRWLALLESQERYVPYRKDLARKNMLRKLLGNA
jgi:hypothetical protein